MGLTQRLGTIPLAIQTDSSNNVGIGTTTPAERLEVFAPAVAGTSQQSRLRITQAGSISARANLVSGVISGENPYFAIETRQSASPYSIVERLRIDGNGNVGIGTSSPTGLLDVANRGITKGSMPAGSVIQVVTFTLTSGASTSGSSDIDTGLNATITPTSSTSQILVIVSANLRAQGGGGNAYVYGKIWRGAIGSGTAIYDGFAMMGNLGSGDIRGIGNATILDSPATTSSITYRFSINSQFATTASLNSTTNPSTITLMEIAR